MRPWTFRGMINKLQTSMQTSMYILLLEMILNRKAPNGAFFLNQITQRYIGISEKRVENALKNHLCILWVIYFLHNS